VGKEKTGTQNRAAAQILTTGDLARLCGVNYRTVLNWIKRGYLPTYKLPGRGDNRITVQEALRFMREHDLPIPDELAQLEDAGSAPAADSNEAVQVCPHCGERIEG
jgi:excisionase family DNA binding protein